MKHSIVHSNRPVTLIGGGPLAAPELDAALGLAPILAAADGGALRALELGHRPVAVIGDLDTLDRLGASGLDPATFHRIAEQESTDFEKCLTRIAAPLVLGVGFTGGRLDHEFAVLNTLVRHPTRRCLLLGAEDVIFHCPPDLHLPLKPGTRVSLCPMAPCRGESTGLRWPIGGIAFAPDGPVGTSNAAEGPVTLRMAGPGMVAMLPRATLDLAAEALATAPPWPA